MKNYNQKFIYFICVVSAMGGLLFGYDWVVIGGAKIFYEQFFQITENPNMQGLAMSIALAGCLLGALTAGAMADRYGRKPLLIISAFIFLISAYGTGFSWSPAATRPAMCAMSTIMIAPTSSAISLKVLKSIALG
jgi:SP family sugar porter-like MFS transporter